MTTEELFQRQRNFFLSGTTRSFSSRRKALRDLLGVIDARQDEILNALQTDLGKAPMEGYLAEVGLVKEEIRFTLRYLKRWMKPERVATPMVHFPAGSRRYKDPLGVVLILAPWNYPFQLCIAPLAAALAAGNCVMLKPSRLAPAVGRVIESIVKEIFPPELAAVVPSPRDGHSERGADSPRDDNRRDDNRQAYREQTSQKLWYQEILNLPYDHIFFTGSERVGKEVMAAAAKHLTPVTLELGGKSPVLVDATADLPLAARRIVWGKCLNAGQTCVAPDYVLVQRERFCELVEELKKEIARQYGEDPLAGNDLPKIISERHFHRLTDLIEEERAGEAVLFGGKSDPANRRIAPTLIGPARFDSPAMREELFGPLLPIIPFGDLSTVIEQLCRRPTPLALYLFTRNKCVERQVIGQLRFGGGCINDTVVHLANPRLPFGGVGASGMGSYHGKAGFDTFSRVKSVLKKGLWLDLPFRYPPYKELFFRVVRCIMK